MRRCLLVRITGVVALRFVGSLQSMREFLEALGFRGFESGLPSWLGKVHKDDKDSRDNC